MMSDADPPIRNLVRKALLDSEIKQAIDEFLEGLSGKDGGRHDRAPDP
jgi:hypothetical protein